MKKKYLLACVVSLVTASNVSYAGPEIVYVPGSADCSDTWSAFCGWPHNSFYDPSPYYAPVSPGGGGAPGPAAPKTETSFNHNRQPECKQEQDWVAYELEKIINSDEPLGVLLPITITDPNFQPGHFWAKYEIDGFTNTFDRATGVTKWYTHRMHYMWRIGGGVIPYQVKMKNSYQAGCVGWATPLPHA